MKEREGCETLVTEDGFLTAKVIQEKKDNIFFINDFFVSESVRKKKSSAIKLFNQAKNTAKKLGCNKMRGSVYIDTLNATEALKANLYYGYKVIAAHDNVIYVQIDL